MADPFTIRVFVPDGDPESVLIIDRMNWTGVGLVFPRTKWQEIKKRAEFKRTGIYVLAGYTDEDDDMTTVYVGQGDAVQSRIDSHFGSKDFWDRAVVFVSTSGGLNRAHVTWLEYALIAKANQAGRCHLDNANVPQEPSLTEAEKADTEAFLKEILQILPLVGLRAFEFPRAVVTPDTKQSKEIAKRGTKLDTVVVPAHKDGFEHTFLGESCWYAIRIAGGMLEKIQFAAAYQTAPVSAITHYAEVERIEPYGDGGKYRLVFRGRARKIGPIPFGDAPRGSMQGTRYTTLERLKTATTLSQLFS